MTYNKFYNRAYAGGQRPNRVWAEIDLDNVRHNYRELERLVRRPGKPPGVMCVVKANAYGHGAATLAKTFAGAGCAFLAVSTLDEALELRRVTDTPLIVLNHIVSDYKSESIPRAIANDVSMTVYSEELARALSYFARKIGLAAKIHIKLDTGMTRAGLNYGESLPVIERISALPNIKIEGVFTHFAMADEADPSFTAVQFERYISVIGELYKKGIDYGLRHVCNSAAAIRFPDMRLDMIRPGIALYGLYPSDAIDRTLMDLRPAMSVKTRVARVNAVGPGVGVSYGHAFTTARASKLATLPCGYADGFSRALSGKASVLINGRKCPVAGRICMDQCVVDVTDAEGPVAEGDEAVIIGTQSGAQISADELARQMGTINYEIVTMQSRRVPRFFYKGGALVSSENYLV